MSYNTTASYIEVQASISGTYPISMYCVNASLSGEDKYYFVNNNQDIYGYKVNASDDTTASEQLYTGLPINRGNLSTNTSGEISGITITIPNVNRVMESLIQNYKYLRGCEIVIITTYSRFLPTGSGAEYIGASPDYRSYIKEKYYIDSANSNEQAITFNCKSKFDIRNVGFPRRKFTHFCSWDYLSTECSPLCVASDLQYANVIASWPICDYTLENCKQRKNSARYGGFPAIPRRGFIVV